MPTATVFEEHSSVLAHWFGLGVSRATLVCLDAHLDLQFIDPQRLARLDRCQTAAEIRALEASHPFSPERSGCYGIEDFLLAAAHLGLVARLIWVAPVQVIRFGLATALQGLQQMEGVSLADLESFHRTDGGWIEGRLLGLDLVICELAQLGQISLDGPLLLDIDTDFFVRVPEDQLWVQPSVVVAELKARFGGQVDVTLARSVGSGFLPLQHRFLADHLAALWQDRQDEAAHWQWLLDQELLRQAGRQDAALAGMALANRPDCAASWYLRCLISTDAALCQVALARAAALDAAYADDLLRRLGEFLARWKRIELHSVVALHKELLGWRVSSQRLAIAWILLGRLYACLGRVDEALQCDLQSRRWSDGHPALALEIARLLMARGELAMAKRLLERAALDDETRVSAWVHLAECAFAQGQPGQAQRLGRLAQQAAPAWPSVLERLAAFAQAVGDTREIRRIQDQHTDLTHRLKRLAARIKPSS